jgi:hypothetical protein
MYLKFNYRDRYLHADGIVYEYVDFVHQRPDMGWFYSTQTGNVRLFLTLFSACWDRSKFKWGDDVEISNDILFGDEWFDLPIIRGEYVCEDPSGYHVITNGMGSTTNIGRYCRYTCLHRKKIKQKITIGDAQKELMDNDSTYNEAATLAIFMFKKYYPENPEFHLCDSTRGLISQIDNMVTGLKRDKSS